MKQFYSVLMFVCYYGAGGWIFTHNGLEAYAVAFPIVFIGGMVEAMMVRTAIEESQR